MVGNLFHIKLIFFVLGSLFYKYGQPVSFYNRLLDRSKNGMVFHHHNLENPQMTVLSAYHPNIMLRRMRLQLIPSKIYPHRGISPTYQNNMRHNFRYTTLNYLRGPANGLNTVKWLHSWPPYQSFNNVFKATQKTNFPIISQDKLRIDGLNREMNLITPVSSTLSYCINTYKIDGHTAHTAPTCVEKMSFRPTPLVKILLTDVKPSVTATNNPYANVSPTNSLLSSKNTSSVYFTIGDADIPRTISTSNMKTLKKTSNWTNYETYLSSDNIKPHPSVSVTKLLTMTSNPIISKQNIKAYQPPNATTTNFLGENKTEAKSLNSENLNTTKSHLVPESMSITCKYKRKCDFEIEDREIELVSSTRLQESVKPMTLKSTTISPIIVTVSTSLNTLTNLENTRTTENYYWNTTERSNYITSKMPFSFHKRINRTAHTRNKIDNINKILIFKEKIKNNERSAILPTLTTILRSDDANTKVKRNFISTTISTLVQTITRTRGKEEEAVTRINSTHKAIKSKIQIKNRSFWTPKNNMEPRKANKTVTTSTKTIMISKPSAETPSKRSHKANKFRLKANRIAKLIKLDTTQSVQDLHLPSTPPMISSTPESAIMRIFNMSNSMSGKLSIAKNSSSNSLVDAVKASNGYVPELPIVTYFKEITEYRQV